MLKGYYIHNQKKDESGVSKKIETQVKVLKKHFELDEILLDADKESWVSRKIRMKILKKRLKINYDKAIPKIENPDFIYIRKQILDGAFLAFLEDIKCKFPKVKIYMEIPTYPYWNEYPKTKLGQAIILEEKRIIPRLKDVVDMIFTYSEDKEIFGITAKNIKNGIDLDSVKISSKTCKDEAINLIVVARWRDVNGYERIINGIQDYYSSGGLRLIRLHMIGGGSETEYYKTLSVNLEENVIFYGFRTGEELEELLDKADIALGCFGEYKGSCTVSSALKIREYLAKGLPIISGIKEDCLSGRGEDFFLEFPNDNSTIDLNRVVQFYDDIYKSDTYENIHSRIRKYAFENVAIDVVFKTVIEAIESGAKE